jgi:hypothetical protein
MSKRRIVVTIDCNAKTCGRCAMFGHNAGPHGYCDIYGYLLEYSERAPECLKAEKGAKR